MDYSKLHQDKYAFDQFLKLSADYFKSKNLNIPVNFIEKDYYIFSILKDLQNSEYADNVYFKGGTALSKQGITDRFSEDLDLFVFTGNRNSSKQAEKNLNRSVSHFIGNNYQEMYDDQQSKIGGDFRKLYLIYNEITQVSQLKQHLEVEIKSVVSEDKQNMYFPYNKKKITSLISRYIEENGRQDILREIGLEPIEINIISPKRTLCDKISRITRIAYSSNFEKSFATHIRDIYDIYKILHTPEYTNFVESDEFLVGLYQVIKEDNVSLMFQDRGELAKSNIFENPRNILALKLIDDAYHQDLPQLLFEQNSLPKIDDVIDTFSKIHTVLLKFDNIKNEEKISVKPKGCKL